MNVRSLLAGLALLSCSSAAVASPAICRPTIEAAWIRAAPPGTTMLAGYARVRNGCARDIAVTGVGSKDFAMSMVHETVMQDGMSQMRHARALAIPAHGVLEFAPGGRHLMLMHPRRAFKLGDRVAVELKLGDGSRMGANFVVAEAAPGR
jgi:hypothetical protein